MLNTVWLSNNKALHQNFRHWQHGGSHAKGKKHQEKAVQQTGTYFNPAEASTTVIRIAARQLKKKRPNQSIGTSNENIELLLLVHLMC